MHGDQDIMIVDVLTVTSVVTLAQIWVLWGLLDLRWVTVHVTVIVQQVGLALHRLSVKHKPLVHLKLGVHVDVTLTGLQAAA
jgi:hypothetical protein